MTTIKAINHPTCRPCGIRGIVTEAIWVMETKEVKNWYLCDWHSQLLAGTANLMGRPLRQLDNSTEVRQRQKESNHG